MHRSILPSSSELDLVYHNFQRFLASKTFTETIFPKVTFIEAGEVFQAMIMGGTHFWSGLFENQLGIVTEQTRLEIPMKVFQDQEGLGDFFLKHLNSDISKVVLNFTFPMQSIARENRLDGRLLRGTKGYIFGELVGHNVGEFLEDYVFEKQNRVIKCMVFNDIIPLALSGTVTKEQKVVGIVGTGLNFGFWKDNKTIVNIEPERFDNYPHVVENQAEITGNDLFRLYNALMLDLEYKSINSTSQLDTLADGNDGSASQIARDLFERSASIVACMIAGIFRFRHLTHMDLVMEGSLFWDSYRYQENVWKYLKFFDLDTESITFIRSLDSLTATAQSA